MRRFLMLNFLLIVLISIAACGDVAPAPAGPAQEAAPAAEEAMEEKAPAEPAEVGPTGTIYVGMSLDPRTLDPRSTGGDLIWTEISHIIEPLFEYDLQAGVFIPKLAESWELIDDLTWQFKLRQGVTFHNGEPFNAESVKYTIESTLDPERNYVNASFLAEVDRVEIIDDYTVNISTKTPFRSLFFNLVFAYMLPPKAAEELGDQFGTNPIGTGAFKFVRYAANEELELVANEDYWGDIPKVKTLIFRVLPEDSTRLAALETGEVAAIPNVSPDAIDQLEANEDVEVVVADPQRIIHLAFIWGRPPFDNLTLRKAFNHAVDRQALVDTILTGMGEVAEQHLYHPTNFGFNDELEPYPYDPDKARELLAEAGYPDGINVKFGCPQGRYLRDKIICEAIVAQFEQVGITTDFEASEWGSFWEKAITSHEYDLFLLGWSNSGDPVGQFTWWFDSGNSPTGYSNERVDELIRESLVTMDEEEAKAVYREIQEVIWEDLPWVSLYFQPKIYAINTKLKDMTLHDTIPLMDFRQAYMEE